jgi:ABC-type polysaccharide/polyol phosphate transport system ATPase subunit
MLNTSIHGLSQADALGLYDAVVAYSGLEHFMDVPLKNYSSGMHMRLGFAIAANLDPDVPAARRDLRRRRRRLPEAVHGELKSFQAQGKTIVFVSHSSAAVQAICHRARLIDRGYLLYDGPVDAALTEIAG